MKAIIYTRVSTDEQADKGYSLPYQKERLETYCQINKIEVVKHFQDDHSAKNFDRPEFKKLLEFVRQNKGTIDLLLVIKWDRFSRNATDSWMMIRTLRQLGTKVDAVEQRVDIDIPEQKLLLSFYLTAPEVENDRRALNTSSGMRRAMKSGRWVSGAPLGYTMGRDAINKPILLINEKALLIKEAFELYSTGLYDKEEVRKKMVRKGLKCEKNNFWKLLHNPVYCGKIRIAMWKDEPEEVIVGLHEPIISEELFYRVQQVASGKKLIKAKPNKRTDILPLRGYLVCSRCGKNLTGSASKGKCGGIYHYYHCQPGCKERHKVDIAHSTFTEWLSEINLKPEIAALYMEVIRDVFKTQIGDTQKEIERLEKEKLKSEEQINKAARKYIDNDLDKSTFKRLKISYETEIYNYSSQIAELKNTDSNFIGYAEYGFTLLSHLNKAYEGTTLEGRQKMLGSIFPDKLVFDGKKYRTPNPNELHGLLFNNSKGFEESKIKLVGEIANQFAVVARRG